MTYRFTCRAAGDVLMLHPDGDAVLRLLGRQPARRGIIEATALPAAIAALEQAVAADAQRRCVQSGHPCGPGDDDQEAATLEADVELRQRTWPLLKLMRSARAAGTEILWGS